MRILHVLPHLSGGGAERQFVYLARALILADHDVAVAYLTPGPAEPELPEVKRFRLEAASNYDLRILAQLVQVMRRFKPDVVQTWILQMDILGGIAARIAGVPWILREPSAPSEITQGFKRKLHGVLARGAKAIVANSLLGHRYWQMRQPEVPSHFVRNGIPVSEILTANAPLPAEVETASDEKFLLAAGRLVRSKNMELLVAGVAAVSEGMKLKVMICGDGPERPVLEALVARMNLGRIIHFAGSQSPEVLWTLMKRAAAYVSTSEYEGCPNTVLEAMICGCSLILSSIPAHRDLVDSGGAVFFDAKDPAAVAIAIKTVLTDDAATAARAAHARELAVGWSIESMRRAYEAVYCSVVQS